MKKISILLILLIIQLNITQISAQEPKAVLSGPEKKGIGQIVVIRTTGSSGKDFKLKVTPATEYYTVRDAESNELILMFIPSTPGNYVVSMAAAAADKCAIATFLVIIDQVNPPTPVNPTPVPVIPADTELVKIFRAAYAKDIAATNGTPTQKNILAAIFRRSPAVIAHAAKVTDIYDSLRSDVKTLGLTDSTLINLRTAIAEFESANLKITATTALTDQVRQDITNAFTKIYQALDSID